MATKHPATTIRLTDEDKELVAELKDRLGIRSTTELIRLALRVLLADSRAAKPPATSDPAS